MERLKLFMALLLVVVCAHSCTLYNDVEVLEVQDVRVKEFSDKVIVAEVDLLIDNPNWYKVKLTKSEIDLAINGKDVGQMGLGEKLTIPKKTKSTHTVLIEADYEVLQTNFLQNFLTLLFNPEVKLKADGYITGRALFVSKKVPVLIEEDIDASTFNLGE